MIFCADVCEVPPSLSSREDALGVVVVLHQTLLTDAFLIGVRNLVGAATGNAVFSVPVRGGLVSHLAGLALFVFPEPGAIWTFLYAALLAGSSVQDPAVTFVHTEVFVVDVSYEVPRADLRNEANNFPTYLGPPGALCCLDAVGFILVQNTLRVTFAYLSSVRFLVLLTLFFALISSKTYNATLCGADISKDFPVHVTLWDALSSFVIHLQPFLTNTLSGGVYSLVESTAFYAGVPRQWTEVWFWTGKQTFLLPGDHVRVVWTGLSVTVTVLFLDVLSCNRLVFF